MDEPSDKVHAVF